MKIQEAGKFWLQYHKVHSKKNTIRAYEWILSKFCNKQGHKDLKEIASEEISAFLNGITEGKKQQTKRIRCSHLNDFIKFTRNNTDENFQNPCDTPMFRKLFRAKTTSRWNIIGKETVDVIVFRTTKMRNRLILELIARGGMRIDEVLKLTFNDI
jgi:site-specific recombinase XerD